VGSTRWPPRRAPLRLVGPTARPVGDRGLREERLCLSEAPPRLEQGLSKGGPKDGPYFLGEETFMTGSVIRTRTSPSGPDAASLEVFL
jgi:hypothetical protein